GVLVGECIAARRSLLVAAVLAFAAGIVPFLPLSLPVFLAGHSRDFAEVASNMPEWSDLANITPENAVWGNALQRLGVTGQADDPVWEAELGFTPAVLAVFILGFALLVMRMRHPPGLPGSAALPSPASARGVARRCVRPVAREGWRGGRGATIASWFCSARPSSSSGFCRWTISGCGHGEPYGLQYRAPRQFATPSARNSSRTYSSRLLSPASWRLVQALASGPSYCVPS